jgi:D-lactate dehydrogenase
VKIAFFDTHQFEKEIFQKENKSHDITFFEPRLTEQSCELASGYPCVCAFANDRLNRDVLRKISDQGTRLIALRSAGFNHVDLVAAKEFGLRVVRVPEYSPYSVAEHAVALIQSLNRKIHRAYNRVRDGNFSLEGLVGFDLHGKTVGIVGTGKIGAVMAKIMLGFGCKVLAFDLQQKQDLIKAGVQYVSLNDLLKASDIVSLHIPLTPQTRHIIDEKALKLTKPGFMLINTGRGGLVDTHALVEYLKSGHIGFAGLDVYEEEERVFFKNLSEKIIQDDQLIRLMTFPNVLLTSHQGFLTHEALTNIARVTLNNISVYEKSAQAENEVSAEEHLKT